MIHCASILLAAGDSSRLGRPKQLLKVGAETLLRRTARLACEAGCSHNLVVLGAFADLLRSELLELPVETIINHDWQQGMGSSLSLGMASLQRYKPEPKAVLLLVSDQPAITTELLQSLISETTTSGKSIAASRYAGALGVPAVFSSRLFPSLAALSGDQGARRLFSLHSHDMSVVDFPDGSFDIDTAADVERLAHRSLNGHPIATGKCNQ